VIYYEAYLTERAAREREGKLKRNRRMRNLLMARLIAGVIEWSGDRVPFV
jgi:hypothetical protein